MTDQLELFGPLGVRYSDPPTSHTAAKIAARRAPNNRERALLALWEHGALTDFEMAAITGVAQTSIGVRRGELVKVGLVVACAGVTRPAPSGSPAQVWRLTEAGEALARGIRP